MFNLSVKTFLIKTDTYVITYTIWQPIKSNLIQKVFNRIVILATTKINKKTTKNRVKQIERCCSPFSLSVESENVWHAPCTDTRERGVRIGTGGHRDGRGAAENWGLRRLGLRAAARCRVGCADVSGEPSRTMRCLIINHYCKYKFIRSDSDISCLTIVYQYYWE